MDTGLFNFLVDTGEVVLTKELEDELAKELVALRAARKQHAGILRKGTQDPFWPDGVNANLVRNHILYHKGRIAELCKQLCRDVPKCAKTSAPKAKGVTFMAPNSRAAKLYFAKTGS